MYPITHQALWALLAAVAFADAQQSPKLEKRDTIPAPIAVEPSQSFDGNDGSWSSFGIQVGTPPQQLRVYASTESDSTWVVLPQGCTDEDASGCSNNRGTEFIINGSSTWDSLGTYSLVYEGAGLLGYIGNAYVGYDNLTLGWPGSGAPELQNQIIEAFAAQYPFLGLLGLVPRAINLTSLNERHTSVMDSLKNANLIPSLSYGYTAGASYRQPQVFGSLTLGGYDTTRFTPNNLTASFGADISRDLLIAVQSISSNSTSDPLMSSGIMALVDSAVSTIWLPGSACEAFERAFNLTWDSSAGLYLLNDSTHEALLALNPTITFQIGSTITSNDSVNIVLPYASFDLQASQPLVANTTRYFPLQRAANQTQYTLGRTFLQESYLIADYERGNFSISQALFPPTAVAQNLVTIYPADTQSSSSSSSSSHVGAIAGGVVGGVVGIALIALILFFLQRRSQKKKKTSSEKTGPSKSQDIKSQDEVIPKAELEAPASKTPHQDQQQSAVRAELPDEPIVYYEMEGSNVQAVEKPGDDGGAEIDDRYSFEGTATEFNVRKPDGEINTVSQDSTLQNSEPPRRFSFDYGSGTMLETRKPEDSYSTGLSGSTLLATERSGEGHTANGQGVSHHSVGGTAEQKEEAIPDNDFLNTTIEHTTPVDSLPRYSELTRESKTGTSGNESRSFPEKSP